MQTLQVMDPGRGQGIVSEDHDDPRGVAARGKEDAESSRSWLFAGAENTGDARPALDLRLQTREAGVEEPRRYTAALDQDGRGVEDAGLEPARRVLCGPLEAPNFGADR